MKKQTAKTIKEHFNNMTHGYLAFIRSQKIKNHISSRLQRLVVPEGKRELVRNQIYARLFFLQSSGDMVSQLKNNIGLSKNKTEGVEEFIEKDLLNKIKINVNQIFKDYKNSLDTPPPPPTPPSTPQAGYGGTSDPYKEPTGE